MTKKNTKPSIVFLDAGSVDLGDIDLSTLKKLGSYKQYKNSSFKEVLKRGSQADIIITNKNILNRDVLATFKNLKLICIAATGYNNIDLEVAQRLHIAVTNVAGYSTVSVAEHTLLFLLSFSHRLIEHSQGAINGDWSHSSDFTIFDYPYSQLQGQTLGIIGYGKIGKRVAYLAKAFGMKVLISKIPGRSYKKNKKEDSRVSFNEVLKKSDFISLHCPLTKDTEHLFDTKQFSLMKKEAYLINVARGPLVKMEALIRALKRKQIKGYAADVLDEEPPKKNHPLFQKELRNKVLLTPHVAWGSKQARQILINEIALNITSFKKGLKRNRLDEC